MRPWPSGRRRRSTGKELMYARTSPGEALRSHIWCRFPDIASTAAAAAPSPDPLSSTASHERFAADQPPKRRASPTVRSAAVRTSRGASPRCQKKVGPTFVRRTQPRRRPRRRREHTADGHEDGAHARKPRTGCGISPDGAALGAHALSRCSRAPCGGPGKAGEKGEATGSHDGVFWHGRFGCARWTQVPDSGRAAAQLVPVSG